MLLRSRRAGYYGAAASHRKPADTAVAPLQHLSLAGPLLPLSWSLDTPLPEQLEPLPLGWLRSLALAGTWAGPGELGRLLGGLTQLSLGPVALSPARYESWRELYTAVARKLPGLTALRADLGLLLPVMEEMDGVPTRRRRWMPRP